MATGKDIEVVEYARQIWPDFPITRQQLVNITPEFVISLYQKFKDTVEQYNESVCDGKRVSIVPKNKQDTPFSLLHFLNKYLRGIIVDPNTASTLILTITDLYDPTSKRSVIRYFVLLQFLTYYRSKLEIFKNLVSTKFEREEELRSKRTKSDDIKGSVEKKIEELAVLEQLLAKLGNDKQHVEARYEKLQTMKDDIDRSNKKLRFDLKAIVDTYNTKQTLLTNVKANIHSLNERIVIEDSYKSMLDLKNNVIKSCEELDEKSHYSSEYLQFRKPEVEHFQEIETSISDLLRAGEELKAVQNFTSEGTYLLKSLQLNYKENLIKFKKYDQDNVKLSNSIQVKTETVHLEAVKHKTMQSNIEFDVQQISKEVEIEQKEFLNERLLYENKINNCEKLVSDVEASIHRLNLVYEDAYNNMLNSANAVTTNLHNSVNELSNLYNE